VFKKDFYILGKVKHLSVRISIFVYHRNREVEQEGNQLVKKLVKGNLPSYRK